jgi:hypothetical protein
MMHDMASLDVRSDWHISHGWYVTATQPYDIDYVKYLGRTLFFTDAKNRGYDMELFKKPYCADLGYHGRLWPINVR